MMDPISVQDLGLDITHLAEALGSDRLVDRILAPEVTGLDQDGYIADNLDWVMEEYLNDVYSHSD